MINGVGGIGGASGAATGAGIASSIPNSGGSNAASANASTESSSRLTIDVPLLADGTVAIPGGVVLPNNNSPAGITAMMELMQGFSMAEMLIAMLMLVASQQKEDDDSKSGAAAMLASLALAAASKDSISINLQINGSMVSDVASLGTTMDLSA